MNAIEFAASMVWALQPEMLETLRSIALRQNETIEAVEARLGKKLENTRVVTVRNGVAVIPINGVIMRRANMLAQVSGATSTEVFAKDITTALENEDVKSLLLTFDSPGGQASGINELAGMIHAAATVKPVKAYVSGMAASAAYWLASAADEIVVDKTAILGSIGVVLSITKKADEAGETTYEIYSTQSPKKRSDPADPKGYMELQRVADDMAAVFIESVAANRGVSVEKVTSDFGQGGVMVGEAAVKAGLADRIGSFEGLLCEMAGGKPKRKSAAASASSNPPATGKDGGVKMKTLKELKASFLAVFAKAEESGGDPEDVRAELEAALTGGESGHAQMATGIISARPDPEVERLKAEVAALQASKREGKAEAFAESLLAEKKVLPAETDAITALYIQAAADDDESPLAEGSRVELVKAIFDKRAAHTISREFGKTKLEVVPSTDDGEDAEVKAEQEATRAYAQKTNSKKAS